jgi:hypothetical protein
MATPRTPYLNFALVTVVGLAVLILIWCALVSPWHYFSTGRWDQYRTHRLTGRTQGFDEHRGWTDLNTPDRPATPPPPVTKTPATTGEEFTPTPKDFLQVVREARDLTGAIITRSYRPPRVAPDGREGANLDLQIPGGDRAKHEQLAQYLNLRGYHGIVELDRNGKGIVVHAQCCPSNTEPTPPRVPQ